ncbi:XkdN-like protein [Clostridium sp. 'deep sea']|uniref:phage tail assembly chaperone n=1 Tax=Clostridium sp. 'deep sea' TaxID=2779445 RepID=UPI00189679F2|nr:XkdN-like protein [Clostridium sp. 'deep sea']QOR33946.1 XkdN-like protein [Clostridium sp. 'deep sea']
MNLQQFLNARDLNETKNIVISERIVIDDKPAEFTIKALTENEAEDVLQRCTKRSKSGTKLNNSRYLRLVAVAGTVNPNFSDSKSLSELGCRTSEEYIKKVLLPGEIAVLAEQILDISGYSDLENLKEQAKN